MFGVKLIKVPPIDTLSSWDVFELMCQARHVAGDYWIFEGDDGCLHVTAEVIAEGITDGTGDYSYSELVTHCEQIFGVLLKNEAPSWLMLKRAGRL